MSESTPNLRNDEVGKQFVQCMIGLTGIVSSPKFVKALEDSKDPTHPWAVKTKQELENLMHVVNTVMIDAVKYYGPDVMKLDFKSLMMQYLPQLTGGAK